MEKLNEKIKEVEANLEKVEKLRAQLEEQNSKLIAEKNDLFLQLQQEKDSVGEGEVKAQKLASQKDNLEKQLSVRRSFGSAPFTKVPCSTVFYA